MRVIFSTLERAVGEAFDRSFRHCRLLFEFDATALAQPNDQEICPVAQSPDQNSLCRLTSADNNHDASHWTRRLPFIHVAKEAHHHGGWNLDPLKIMKLQQVRQAMKRPPKVR